MTDNANKNQDADLVEMKADQPNSQPEQSSSFAEQSQQRAEQRSSGSGFVWLLAALLVMGGGSYAVWPFVAPTVEPVLKQARATLGFAARPTQPSLPKAPPMDQPMDQPTDQRVSGAPIVQTQPAFQPQSELSPAPIAEAPVAEVPVVATPIVEALVVETRVAETRIVEPPTPALPVTVVAREAAPDLAPMVQSLTDRLNILEAQLLSATANSNTDQASAALESNGQLLRTLSGLRADLVTLKTRVAALESAPRGRIDPSASAQALVLSVTQLASLVETDRPYGATLDALERIGGADPVVGAAVARLRPYANSGVPAQASIAAEFKAVAVAVMKAHGQTQRTGWLDEMVGAASSLVTVRQTDPARIEDPVERALAIAELALADNDLKTALAAMQSLQGAEGNAASRWREAAHARASARDAVDVLHNHALAALAATGGA